MLFVGGPYAAMLEMFTIEPPSPSNMRLPTSAVRRNGPLRLSPTVFSQSSSVTSRTSS